MGTLLGSIYGSHQPLNGGSFSHSPSPGRCFPRQAGGGCPHVPTGSQGQGAARGTALTPTHFFVLQNPFFPPPPSSKIQTTQPWFNVVSPSWPSRLSVGMGTFPPLPLHPKGQDLFLSSSWGTEEPGSTGTNRGRHGLSSPMDGGCSVG